MKRRTPVLIEGREHWRCPGCTGWFTAECYFERDTWNGIGSHCRRCHGECNMRTRDADRARDSNVFYMRRARTLNPEKFRLRERSRCRPKSEKRVAREVLNRAVRSGAVTRPTCCERCGNPGRVQGHHHDYSKPLIVTWLCVACHGIEHRQHPRESVQP